MTHPDRIDCIPRHALTAAAMVCESHGAHVTARTLYSLANDVDAQQGVLRDCERFLIGFEDDATQPEVAALLARLRALLPPEAVADNA
jgi:hypothetical protein